MLHIVNKDVQLLPICAVLYTDLDKHIFSVKLKLYSQLSVLTHVLDAQKHRLICFSGEIRKNKLD